MVESWFNFPGKTYLVCYLSMVLSLLTRDVNDHKCTSIVKRRYRTDWISKRNENVQICLGSDRKKNRNVYRGHFLFINKAKQNEVLIFLSPSKTEVNKALILNRFYIKTKRFKITLNFL